MLHFYLATIALIVASLTTAQDLASSLADLPSCAVSRQEALALGVSIPG